MEETTTQEKVLVFCYACFNDMEVSMKHYKREEEWYRSNFGKEPRFYCCGLDLI